MRTFLQSKAMAKALRESLAAKSVSISHSECLEIVARQFGFGEWNTLAACIETHTNTVPKRQSGPIEMQPPIPMLRIASVREAKEFYADYLGFSFGWDEADAKSAEPAYIFVSRSGVELHLDESPQNPATASMVLIRLSGLDAFCHELSSKNSRFPAPTIHFTPYDSRVMFVRDPFGNTLRFWENNPSGVAWQE